MTQYLSKSRFMSGSQCELRLWYDVHARQLASEADESLEAIFETGREVGELAQQRWTGGVLVDEPYWDTEAAVKRTRALMKDPSVPAIFEAAFVHRGVLTRVDILARAPRGRWDLIEVKSSSSVKEPHRLDIAIQYWILHGKKVPLRRAGVLVLNKDYVYEGGELDLQALFHFEDCSTECHDNLRKIGRQAGRLQVVMAQKKAPHIDIGDHCSSPYQCPYLDHCSRDLVVPDLPITLLPGIGVARAQPLIEQGYTSLHELPPDMKLIPVHARVRDCHLNGRPWASKQLKTKLNNVAWPLHFLDFEAVGFAIPRHPGTRPFQAMPFQFSCHHQAKPGARLTHDEYLAVDNDDPREAIAKSLLKALGDKGSIIVYSSYEKRMINQLAAWLPKLAGKLKKLIGRLVDLLPIVQNHYYHPDFQGTYSIKAVLPALVKGMSYDGMDVADGMAAVNAWRRMIQADSAMERRELKRALLAYCRQDSLAMAELRMALLKVKV